MFRELASETLGWVVILDRVWKRNGYRRISLGTDKGYVAQGDLAAWSDEESGKGGGAPVDSDADMGEGEELHGLTRLQRELRNRMRGEVHLIAIVLKYKWLATLGERG